MTRHDTVLTLIQERNAHIGLIGAGYVGLPLATEFAEAGFCVTALDIDTRKIDAIQRGESYIEDVPAETLQRLVESGALQATADYSDLQAVDVVIIAVPTPLKPTKEPDMTYVIAATESLAEVVHDGLLVVLESTTYPGTTDEVIRPRLEQNGLHVGENLFIAFSGERIDPGNAAYGVHNTPKVIGGVTDSCTTLTTALYETIVAEVVPVSSPRTAEMVKLLENTFRAVNIALINEMALMCDKLGLDVWEVVDAAATKPFGFMPFYPGPGVGGHCIPIDPHYLSWKLRTLDYHARFIDLASDINTGMPAHVVTKITDALNQDAKAVNGARIVVLGVAYKPNVNDVRESPALHVMHLLQQKGGDVVYHDSHVPELRLPGGATLESGTYSDALLREADCVVIITNHADYDWQHVLSHSQRIVDTRNVYPNAQDDPRIVRL